MEEGQLTFEDDPSQQDYRRAVERIRRGDFQGAWTDLDAILGRGVSTAEIYPLLKGLRYWLNRAHLLTPGMTSRQVAESLAAEWDRFELFRAGAGLEGHPEAVSFRFAVWKRIADEYVRAFHESAIPDPDLLVELSLALVKNEEWDHARETLEYARKFRPRDGRLMAWLGEVHHRLGDEDRSLLFFRDALFFQPDQVPFDQLKAPLLVRLAELARKEGFNARETPRWMFVFGEVDNVLWVKRALTPEESKRIEKTALDLEVDLEIRRRERGELEPRLLAHYLYLLGPASEAARVDPGAARPRVAALLAKIRQTSPRIYERLARRGA